LLLEEWLPRPLLLLEPAHHMPLTNRPFLLGVDSARGFIPSSLRTRVQYVVEVPWAHGEVQVNMGLAANSPCIVLAKAFSEADAW
jgi:hypothetical protein